MTLLWFVMGYWVISVAIGLISSLKVKNTKDFAIAGRQLPFWMVVATVFATWFGSEAVLGIPATFLKDGLAGIVADPFGASLCLILFGLLLASPLYKMNLLTIGDFYRRRYGRGVEIFTTLSIVVSYLGWVGAQITALGIVFNVVSHDAISTQQGMWLGSITILIYTFFGGMWAVAVTDFLQMIVIVLGLLWIGGQFANEVGGIQTVIEHAQNHGKLSFGLQPNVASVLGFTAALVTMMFGSMPQQDVFQRTQSAKTRKIAVWATVLGGSLYFVFTFIPLFIGYTASLLDPAMVQKYINEGKTQLILPTIILNETPLVTQVIFFGALLSAIKGCASATLLAPSVSFTSNILGEMFPNMDDRKTLITMRVVTLIFTILVTFYAMHSDASIFEMVENAYQITLVGAFVPLIFGVFWSKATNQGAILSILMGVTTWILMLITKDMTAAQIQKLMDPFSEIVSTLQKLQPLEPQGAGLLFALLGMIIGSLMPQMLAHDKSAYKKLREGKYQDINFPHADIPENP